MNNNLAVFNSDEFGEVRVVNVDGESVFIAKDICTSLDYTWNGNSRIAHVPSEWRGVTSVVTTSGTQKMAYLTEQGVYFFLVRSDKPKALPLQKWISGDVIPSIRKTGLFATLPAVQCGLVTQLGTDTWTTTEKIAEVFGRRHDNVITAFERGMEECERISDEMSLENRGGLEFKMELTSYIDSRGRVQPCYRINRPLFNYVALNFTGDNANKYRFMFIHQFEAMDRYIRVQLAKQMIYTKEADQSVYVIKNEQTGLVKIGVAKDPLQRMQTLANQSGCRLQMVYCTPKCKNAYSIEQDIHKRLSEDREVGEWFNVPEVDVVDILQSMALDFGSGFLGLEDNYE